MIDKTKMPYLKVILTKKDTKNFNKYLLPEGFTFYKYEKGLELEWVKLNIVYENYESFGQAINYFQNVFIPHPDLLEKQVLFVKNTEGQVVATACIWLDNHFGVPVQRIHSLAVHPFYREKGIAKAMVSKLLEIYQAQNYNTGIYITSDTFSYKEINLFFSFGFVAYTGPKPQHWNSTVSQFETNKPIAWKIIRDNIGLRLHEIIPDLQNNN